MAQREEFEPWIEKFRPKKLSEVIGQTNIIERLEHYLKNRNLPHLLFAGSPGTGKTTCTLALARELYGDKITECFLELNASDERGIDIVRGRIKDFARTLPLSDTPFKIILLDEADALTDDAQQALRRTMEKYSSTTRFVLSCNYSSKIIEPIQSRCAVFRFKKLSDADVEKLVHQVAQKEDLKVDDDAVKAIVYVAFGDARKALNVMQGAAGNAKHITPEIIYSVASRAKPEEVRQMIDAALKGKFTDARKLLQDVMANYGLSGQDVLSQIYQEVTSLDVDDRTKVELVDKVGEYDFRISEGANEMIQLEALLAQIMLVGAKK